MVGYAYCMALLIVPWRLEDGGLRVQGMGMGVGKGKGIDDNAAS